MNLYFVITREMKLVEFFEDGYTLYEPGYLSEYVFAATPGQAKYTFIQDQSWDDCEWLDIASCICLQKDVHRERSIADYYNDPLISIPCPTCGDKYQRPGMRVKSFKCPNCKGQIVLGR